MEEQIINSVSKLLTDKGFAHIQDDSGITRHEREYADGQGKKFAVLLAHNPEGVFVSFHFDNTPLVRWTKAESAEGVRNILLEKGLRL